MSSEFQIPGMESVVATVSGYHGSERFKLIKLITQAGASYVGAMSQSITHLVCWKHQGNKYELARNFKTVVVNHRWIEDCIQQRRRVLERPYMLQCGKEVGPLLLDIQPVADKDSPLLPDKCNSSTHHKKAVIEIKDEPADPAASISTNSHNEWLDLLSELERSKRRSHRLKRETCKKPREYQPSIHGYFLDEPPLSGSKRIQSEKLSSPSNTRSMRQKTSTSSAEPSRKGHVLAKKFRNIEEFSSDFKQERRAIQVGQQQKGNENQDCFSVGNGIESVSIVGGSSDDRIYDHGEGRIDELNLREMESHHKVLVLEDSSLFVECASSSLAGSPEDDYLAVSDKKGVHTTELSCVICWTEFSSTRGVLPCGHRFCFSCIQSWADHMACKNKVSTCPLCKASFLSIMKVDDPAVCDQKIYSQTIPSASFATDVLILPSGQMPSLQMQMPVCCHCNCQEPVDLLIRCHLCQIRSVHSYCLDPPLYPWTCVHCKDLQQLYHVL